MVIRLNPNRIIGAVKTMWLGLSQKYLGRFWFIWCFVLGLFDFMTGSPFFGLFMAGLGVVWAVLGYTHGKDVEFEMKKNSV